MAKEDEDDRSCVLIADCPLGYVRDTNQNRNRCRAPHSGHYANTDGVEQVCATRDIAHSLSIGGKAEEVADDASCPFTCEPGYAENPTGPGGPSCDVPAEDHYIDSNGEQQACDPVLNAVTLGGGP